MNKLMDKAKRMLGENRRYRMWKRWAGALGVVVAVVSCASLVNAATAYTGGNVFSGCITDDSAVYARVQGAGDASWQQADEATPLPADPEAKLRVAFDLPAGTLKDTAVLSYTLPQNARPNADGTATGAVYTADTEDDPASTDAVAIGSFAVEHGVVTVSFDDAAALSNRGAIASSSADDATDASSSASAARAAQAVAGYFDVPLDVDALAFDSAGSCTIALNDDVQLKVERASDADVAARTAIVDATVQTNVVDGAADADASDDGAGASDDGVSNDTAVTASAASASNADSSATASADVGTTVAPARALRMATLDAADEPASDSVIDMSDYLTTGTVVEKIVNGKWTAVTQVNDGDKVRVSLGYALPAGLVTDAKRTLTYTLPSGLVPNEASSGRATNADGDEIGDYTINTDGTVTVTFDKSFADKSESIIGAVEFSGTATNTSGGSKGTIHFGGKSADVTVVSPVEDPYDITSKKTGSITSDHKTASYEVTIGTTKGTGDVVTVADTIDYNNCSNAKPTYQKDSLSIYKLDASGAQTEVTGYTPTWTADASGVGFSVSGLPALAKGEKYIARYMVDVNAVGDAQAGKVQNSAGGTSGNHNSWDWNTQDWKKEIVKTGYFDKEQGVIAWRIKVNPNGRDVSGWTVRDALPEGCTLWGSYTVWGEKTGTLATDGTYFDTMIDYRFPASGLSDAQKKDTYYIDFWTTAPADNRQVSNKGQVWETNSYDESTTTVDIVHRDYDVAKSFTSESLANHLHENRWHVDATLPDTQLSTFTYTDTIDNAVDGNNIDQGVKSHYTLATKLEDAFSEKLYIKVDDYTQYQYKGANNPAYYYRSDDPSLCHNADNLTIKVTYYDANGNEVKPTDSTTPVKKFTITVTAAEAPKFFAKHLVIDEYKTITDDTTAVEGTTWTVRNNGLIGGHTATATHDISILKTFDKQVYTGTDSGGAAKYKSGATTVDYDEMGGVLTYRLMLNTTAEDNGTITITDVLPAGQALVGGSVTATFFDSEYYSTKTNYAGTTFVDGTNPQYTAVPNEDGTTTLTITITDYTYTGNHPKVAVMYETSIASDAVWGNPFSDRKTYTNTASWNSHAASQSTTVKRESKPVAKTGVQLDKDGNPVVIKNGKPNVTPSNKVRYYVDINPAGKNLNPQENTLTLTDTMQDLSRYAPELEMSSVKLYAYDVAAEHHVNTSKQISPDRYSVKYDQAKGQISVTLPDELPCVLVYEYEIDKNSVVNDAEVKNNCSLDGSWSSSDAIKLHEISSSASASHKKITLYKVDEDNNQKLLDGAVFSLERWDASSQSWVMASSSVAPVGGVFTWDAGGMNPPLDADALYRLVETTAPDGYALDATPHYFIWMDTANNASTSYNASGASSAKKPDGSTGINQSDIALFKNAGGMLYVSDKYTRLTVKKEWASEDGSETDAPAGSNVQVELKRFLRAADPDQTCTVHIHAEGTASNPGGWTGSLDAGTLDIQRGSALTLRIGMWGGMSMKALVDGNEYANFTLTGQDYTLTIDADQLTGATADVDIVVTNAGNAPNSIDIVDYTKPAAKNSDAMVVDTVTLDASNGWEKSWENLPAKDDAGNPYRYAVEETGCSVPTKGVAYTNDDGIQTGTIAVTNTIGEDYTLPATGGHGVWPWVAVGAVIAAAAAAGIVARRRVRGLR